MTAPYMKELIKTLFEKLACKHSWKEIYSQNWRGDFGNTGVDYVLSCEKCGKFKKIKL